MEQLTTTNGSERESTGPVQPMPDHAEATFLNNGASFPVYQPTTPDFAASLKILQELQARPRRIEQVEP
ncbi:MAG: hypothetical protein TR69_WS6001000457 [candidate division WS6 bacterium OLB20]|uniref:Uncharacterized protein n=1 Tax=candidate division WS6 bacterium OLB20 TaxID=1617426 RepID=A0A136LXR5_9BACT|nr:MAG: hypothetical protein TR69_WS6001000457 [candidate division WS6 bacterium OLB20]